MKKYILILGMLIITSCSSSFNSFEVTVANLLEQDRADELVSIDKNYLLQLHPDFDPSSFLIKDGDKSLPYQIEVNNENEFIVFVVDIKSKETKNIEFLHGGGIKSEKFPSKTYAELAMKVKGVHDGKKFLKAPFENVENITVPKIHTDHDALFKYEGPGWESEKVGYRFYLDWRNATDIFGKKVNSLVLKNVGVTDSLGDNDSYHNMQDWGMDVFKVGSSLGIGALGMWYDNKVNMVSKTDSVQCAISENGPIRSKVTTKYFGWEVGADKYFLQSEFSISAGSRLTKHEITIDNNPENLVTGLAKHDQAENLDISGQGDWSCIALYGKQSLNDDNLGIALFYNKKYSPELTEDNLSRIVKMKPVDGEMEYYFCATWEKEFNGIKNKEEFKSYLIKTLAALNNKLIIE